MVSWQPWIHACCAGTVNQIWSSGRLFPLKQAQQICLAVPQNLFCTSLHDVLYRRCTTHHSLLNFHCKDNRTTRHHLPISTSVSSVACDDRLPPSENLGHGHQQCHKCFSDHHSLPNMALMTPSFRPSYRLDLFCVEFHLSRTRQHNN